MQITLPIGISFYTFQTMSYTIDIYRGELQPTRSFLDFSLFVAFFPQLVAGPIVRASEFLPQLRAPRALTRDEASRALYLIAAGLFKKVALSSYLAATIVDPVFAAEIGFTFGGQAFTGPAQFGTNGGDVTWFGTCVAPDG